MVGRTVLAGHMEDLVVLDVIGELAADAAERAQAVDRAVGIPGAGLLGIEQGRGHQRAGRAGLHALAAGDAGAVAHRVVEVEDDLLVMAAARHADDVVDLHFAAGADAEVAVDAGVEVHRHRRMADVERRPLVLGEATGGDADLAGPVPEFRIRDRATSRAPAGRRPEARTPSCARLRRAPSRRRPSCRASACAGRKRPARARPRSRPCRRGSCRRAGSSAPSNSRDAGCRRRAAGRPARWSRRRGLRPRSRRG